jgi:two-component system cell cycle response regulator
MDIVPDKILIVADTESKAAISNSLEGISGVEILEADTENKAFELIYDNHFVLIIIDETLAHIDSAKIGFMLLSHKHTYNAPLLIITDKIQPEKFLTDFKDLLIDYIEKPVNESLFMAKVKIFYELFKQKNAVTQSIDELDRAYKKIISQHELMTEEEFSRKEMITRSAIVGNQINQPLQNLKSNIYQLLGNHDATPKMKLNLASLKTSSERISQITRKLQINPVKSKMLIPGLTNAQNNDQTNDPANNTNKENTFKLLYIEPSDEDFGIFNHFIKGALNCELSKAKTIEGAVELIAGTKFDFIFMAHLLADGTGLDLLARLNKIRSDVPVIFALNKPDAHLGPEAVTKGAFNYFIKEEVTCEGILSIMSTTLARAQITQEVEDARTRVVMISRKDALTRLYNRQCFEKELESEAARARRYQTALSIMIVDFDKFKAVNKAHGYDTGDAALTTSAALIQSMVRGDDRVCRYGGEEFGIVLPNTAINGARILADRIRNKIAGHDFKKGSTILKLTVSIGIASYVPETDTSFAILVRNALSALDTALENGGNKVQTFIN